MKASTKPKDNLHIQDKIYRNMSAKNKLELVNIFFTTAKILANLNHGRKNTYRNLNINRQNS